MRISTGPMRILVLLWIVLFVAGCGSTKTQLATQQLLISDSVDRAVASINFRPLSGQKVYLETKYISHIKGDGVVNSQYVISALRQQMVMANCHLVDKPDQADYIVEARVGALGTDAHDVTYGLPASSMLNHAAALLPNVPPIPLIPEISLAKRTDELGATKIAVFAYSQKTKTPRWKSGTSLARSTAKNTWLLGAGPFQSGTIYHGPHFAGEKLDLPLIGEHDRHGPDPLTMFNREVDFPSNTPEQQGPEVQTAAFSQETNAKTKSQTAPSGKTASKPAPKTEPQKKPAPTKDKKPAPKRIPPVQTPASSPASSANKKP